MELAFLSSCTIAQVLDRLGLKPERRSIICILRESHSKKNGAVRSEKEGWEPDAVRTDSENESHCVSEIWSVA